MLIIIQLDAIVPRGTFLSRRRSFTNGEVRTKRTSLCPTEVPASVAKLLIRQYKPLIKIGLTPIVPRGTLLCLQEMPDSV